MARTSLARCPAPAIGLAPFTALAVVRERPDLGPPARGLRCHMAFAVLFITHLGCAAGKEPRDPHEALRSYAMALRESRTRDAYALLSQDAQARVSYADFSRMVAENAREIEDISAGLLQPAEAPQVTATLTSPDGDTLLLIYERGAWRVDGSALNLYSQDTPTAALQSFVRAFDNQRYDVLMRFVPEAKREGLTALQLEKAWKGEQREQLERLTQALKASLPNVRVEIIGDRATVAYGAGGTVELIHERGVWRIEDF